MKFSVSCKTGPYRPCGPDEDWQPCIDHNNHGYEEMGVRSYGGCSNCNSFGGHFVKKGTPIEKSGEDDYADLLTSYSRLKLVLRRCLEAMDEGASREGVWLGMEDAYNAGYAALGEEVP